MSEYVSALDTIYSEEEALKYAKELINQGKEQEFLESTPLIMLGNGKTTWYSLVLMALIMLQGRRG